MSERSFEEFFSDMDFFEVMEENGTFIYCYEPERDKDYLIASDDIGNMPREGALIMVACYAANDVFLWKTEFADIDELYKIYKKSGGKAAFIDELKARSDS